LRWMKAFRSCAAILKFRPTRFFLSKRVDS